MWGNQFGRVAVWGSCSVGELQCGRVVLREVVIWWSCGVSLFMICGMSCGIFELWCELWCIAVAVWGSCCVLELLHVGVAV